MAPLPGVLQPPPGQLILEILPGGRVSVKDLLTQTSDAPVVPTRFTGILILPDWLKVCEGAIHGMGAALVLVIHQPARRLPPSVGFFVPNGNSHVTMPFLGPPSRVSFI